MPKVRGVRNPFPKKIPATNSGILGHNGQKQKHDGPARVPAAVKRAFTHAHKNTNAITTGIK